MTNNKIWKEIFSTSQTISLANAFILTHSVNYPKSLDRTKRRPQFSHSISQKERTDQNCVETVSWALPPWQWNQLSRWFSVAAFRDARFSFHIRGARDDSVSLKTRHVRHAAVRATRKSVLTGSIHFRRARRVSHWNNKRRTIFACRETQAKSSRSQTSALTYPRNQSETLIIASRTAANRPLLQLLRAALDDFSGIRKVIVIDYVHTRRFSIFERIPGLNT